MGQLSPDQLRAKRMIDKRMLDRDRRERQAKQLKIEMRGKAKINGRYYDEKAICETKHQALKIQAEIKVESGLPTTVRRSATGWRVLSLAVAG